MQMTLWIISTGRQVILRVISTGRRMRKAARVCLRPADALKRGGLHSYLPESQSLQKIPDFPMPAIHSPVLIVGSGPAGYTAAIYAARALLKPVLIAGIDQGGQLMITTEVENYPGYADPVMGPFLMEQMLAQAKHVGATILNDHIVEADISTRPFRLKGDSGQIYTGDALIIATGAKAKWLGVPGESKHMGFGVSACATCDGFFFRGKHVAVIGGGNSAVEEALYLSNLASKVTVIHRRDSFRGERILQERLAARKNVEVIWDTVVDEILGNESVPPAANRLALRNVKTGAASVLAIDGVFVAIGHAPQTALFEGKLRKKPSGYLWTAPDSTATEVAGVFAAGDITDDVYRQAVTAAGMGCMAALEAEKFLAAAHGVRQAAE
jgi:thioredoxin reductase (NADPH)